MLQAYWPVCLGISTHGPARGPTQRSDRSGITLRNFNSRPREGADFDRAMKIQAELTFQLTAPRGGRRVSSSTLSSASHFNSRPREGADCLRFYCFTSCEISTHGPARGPTAILDNDPLSKIVFFILLHNSKDFSITFLYGFFFFHSKSAFFQVRIF